MAASARIKVRSDEALDRIFRAHYERIARVIGRVINDQARAEELAVEVFLKWWKRPEAHGDYAEGWLYRSAVRKALDEFRSQSRRTRFEALFRLERGSPPTPEHLYAAATGQQRVRSVLSALKSRDGELLLLRAEDLSYQEIAVALQLNPHSVGSLISRAQTAFRKEYLKRYGNE